MSQVSIFTAGRPSATRLLDRLFDFVQSHIFTYKFSAHDFIHENHGVRIDPDLAITLWTNARLLAEGVNITPDVITYCNDHRLPLPPRVLTYNYTTGYNPLVVERHKHDYIGFALRVDTSYIFAIIISPL